MKRRNFIRLTTLGAGIGAIAPMLSLANDEKRVPSHGDIFYTKDHAGRWEGKSATHLPVITSTKAGGDTVVKVTTPHEMKGYEHYIVKHVLLDKDYKFLDEHLFDPTKEQVAESTFTLKNYKGAIHALSFCNKHDLWLSSAEI
jgi:superoxide reductase